MRLRGLVKAASSLLLFNVGVWASVVHDESVDGDLSNDRLNPTAHALSLGTNSLIATSVTGDREYVMLSVPGGTILTAINLVSYTGLDETAFIGMQSGTTFTEPPVGADVANILGYTHFGPGAGNVGTDVLDDIGTGPGAIGFTPPLPAGDYTYWIQQTGQSPATYQFDYIVNTPEPATLALAALAALLLRRRR